MPVAIGFDVYGTLVDPLKMNQQLRPLVGANAERFAALWREKQIEYAFRRGLMEKYEDFGVCTKQALLFAMRVLNVDFSAHTQDHLMSAYQNLEVFTDVIPGLNALKQQGHTLVAFSNGVEATVRTLLKHANVLPHLDQVISVDDVKTFKPSPLVYNYLARRVNRALTETWLVSSNPWDVIGAKSSGLKAAWIKRTSDKVFDPWSVEPDVVVSNLEELPPHLAV